MGARVVPLRRVGLAIVAVMLVTSSLTGGPVSLLVPALVLAGGLTMAWNGLSFTAAAELAGAARTGAAIGLQQTVLGASGVVVFRLRCGRARSVRRLVAPRSSQ
jgi:hypothetical protein